MKEPLRRKNLHSIISKISGSVEVSRSEEGCSVDNENTSVSQNDKANSEMKIADEQHKPMGNMFITEGDTANVRRSDNGVMHQKKSQVLEGHDDSFSCQLCHVNFFTRRELQLHVMCHGIYITDDTSNSGATRPTDGANASDPVSNQRKSASDKEVVSRKSPVIQKHKSRTQNESSSGQEQNQATLTNAPSNMPEESSASVGQSGLINTVTGAVTSDISYRKSVDVLSLATATRGFKEPGSIWCSLCKCTVTNGHICKVHQISSYHADKTEEGFTCELCGRYYNQKRKLRTHLRNRHKGFRLQEDEGYMCWQCWQAFPEIKILEEHIVKVHGHESRRQNSTWRPFTTTPSTLPTDGEATDAQSTPLPTDTDTVSVTAPLPHAQEQTTSLKRPGDTMPSHNATKRATPEGAVGNDAITIEDSNSRVVVNDNSLVATDVRLRSQSNSPSSDGPSSSNPESSAGTGVDGTSPPQLHVSSAPDGGLVTRLVSTENTKSGENVALTNANRSTAEPTVSLNNVINNPGAGKKKTMTYQKRQQCPHCPETFSRKYMLQLHIQQNHGETMHCFFCSTSCATKDTLAAHIKNLHPDEVRFGKCPICQCKCLGELHTHIVQYHHKDLLICKDKERVLSTCPICHQTTTDAYHLRWHILKEHRGLQLSVDQLEGSNEEMGSEGGSERLERVSPVTMGTSEGNGVEEEANEHRDPSLDDVEIVFVSDNNINSDWSKPRREKTHGSESDPKPSAKDSVTRTQSPPASALSVVKPADSSMSSNTSPKLMVQRPTADNVDSTTEKEDLRTSVSPVTPQYLVSSSQNVEYARVSEEACIFCFKSFPEKETLVSHLRSAHGWVDTFTCPICYFRAGEYLSVVEHFCVSHFHPIEETGTKSEAKCLKCDIIFQDIAHLKKHSSALHSFQIPAEPTYNTFKCRHCNIIFEKQFDAQKHFDVYHLFRIRYKCESCRMGFTAKHDFQEHVTCNHPELVKSFCPVCGLGFEVNADLEEHVFEMHRRKAQFHCALCGNEFVDRFHVHMHIRSNCCVKWADSNFECLDCLTAFSSIAELRIHCNQRNCKASAKK